MIGAIIGDIVGSRFEFVEDGYRGKDFALFASGCRFTDDSLMTLAVAKSLLLSKGNYDNLGELTIQIMKDNAKQRLTKRLSRQKGFKDMTMAEFNEKINQLIDAKDEEEFNRILKSIQKG